jgi:hypothetical protein
MRTQYGLIVYLFEPFYRLYKDKVITPKFILMTLKDLKDEGVEPEALRGVEFEHYKRKLGGGRVIFTFPEELHEWYSDINLNKKRGLWLELHHKLLDKFQKVCYNIQHQNQ